eukprot:Phypoly_transcript_13092.p1 GENE.Phypoly_transcript_13092~~Phypoly_transcript_13092.p1  ORF type:complete len:290 (+),score=33.85 Phypoly_transcript_13092:89-958(+)
MLFIILTKDTLQEIISYLEESSILSVECTCKILRSYTLHYWKLSCARLLKESVSLFENMRLQTLKDICKHVYALPTRLDTRSYYSVHSEKLIISDNGLTVAHLQPGEQVAFGNMAFDPSNRKVTKYIFQSKNGNVEKKIVCTRVMYFEVEVDMDTYQLSPNEYGYLQNGDTSNISIGLIDPSYPYGGEMPGWFKYSFGYHSNGSIYNKASRINRTSNFGPGDTVGCGWDWQENVLFYTLNGKKLAVDQPLVGGVPFKFYPAVGFSQVAKVHVNFGNLPFKFDIETYESH